MLSNYGYDVHAAVTGLGTTSIIPVNQKPALPEAEKLLNPSLQQKWFLPLRSDSLKHLGSNRILSEKQADSTFHNMSHFRNAITQAKFWSIAGDSSGSGVSFVGICSIPEVKWDG